MALLQRDARCRDPAAAGSCGMFRVLKAHRPMALSAAIIIFVRLPRLEDLNQAAEIYEAAIRPAGNHLSL